MSIDPATWIAIQQLAARYVDAVDRHDAELLTSCWASKVKDRSSGKEVDRSIVVGRAVDIWAKRTPDARIRHFITNFYVYDASETVIRARTGICMATATSNGLHLDAHYAYDDEIVREDDGEWRFAARSRGPYELVERNSR